MSAAGIPGSFDVLDTAIKVGAVLLGSILAWWSAYFFENRRLKEAKKGTAYSLIFKVLKAADDVWKLNQHLAQASQAANLAGIGTPLWTKLPDTLGFISEPELLTAQELALVADTQDVDLVMSILEVESGRHIIMQAVNKIQELKGRIADLKLAIAVDGRTVTFGGSAEDYPNYAHIFINLNDISEGLAEQAERIAIKAGSVSERIGPHLKQHYKFKKFATLAMAPTAGEEKPD